MTLSSSLPLCVPSPAMHAFELGLWAWSLSVLCFPLDYTASQLIFVPTTSFLSQFSTAAEHSAPPSFVWGGSHTFDDWLFRGLWCYVCVCLHVYHICACPKRPEKSLTSPGTGVTDCRGSPCGCWELNPVVLQALLSDLQVFIGHTAY